MELAAEVPRVEVVFLLDAGWRAEDGGQGGGRGAGGVGVGKCLGPVGLPRPAAAGQQGEGAGADAQPETAPFGIGELLDAAVAATGPRLEGLGESMGGGLGLGLAHLTEG